MTQQKTPRRDFAIYDRTGELRLRVERAAQQADLNRSQWIRHAIREKLERQGI
ncbi:hypothetical protein [Synechocystis salina]|jgi:hypothetical protein|uniref:Ribbon-helix-helix protein CopG domain-containing protein n=1 Tax=Synechocystis salina LEGE 00031 TaxID=1828736 RepID=A0ABR9VWF7_9SYNC|nr:hypothetical protein [Synechocystis salina]MBE9242683.1 hypothetical protein [Synechocystis salina LEGE 00041]MBE9255692.1 hypothetical protein [Synechocystis salina LEGE 00031]